MKNKKPLEKSKGFLYLGTPRAVRKYETGDYLQNGSADEDEDDVNNSCLFKYGGNTPSAYQESRKFYRLRQHED